ncbi:uncharacterized protein K452DRAFT_282707 [Aplosporella prunicola CBS 121167]|uniref:DUF7730 domain-containing protein n=1 Tax=Aplosporella prunicola CBS 121167 TaxID=1176127 RepID=A0A6A6BTG0_9PEZI|nr:uncharacterized protein K452DRAFT_282707 [Aplosporella prunicola CBS 121167]KAF2146534.1 hypothetical protein K452DRAFT_282707 [Aplosporella prunicola CBS 121167]
MPSTTRHHMKRHNLFPFLDLPAELRNEVYKHLFQRPSKSWIHISSCESRVTHRETGPSKTCKCYVWTSRDETSFPLQVLRTNCQIHDEAAAVLYGLNRFRMNTHCVRCFLAGIGQSAPFVRQLKLLVLNPTMDMVHLFGTSSSTASSTAPAIATTTVNATTSTGPAYTIFSDNILLNQLTVQWVYQPANPDEAARYIYERMLGWIEAVGVKQKDRFAALGCIVNGKGKGPSVNEVRGALRRLMEREVGDGSEVSEV